MRILLTTSFFLNHRVENGKPIYNYSLLDTLIQTLWQNGLKPGFEIMGNPSDFFTDFENKTQVYLWRDLIQEMAEHFIGKYFLIKFIYIFLPFT